MVYGNGKGFGRKKPVGSESYSAKGKGELPISGPLIDSGGERNPAMFLLKTRRSKKGEGGWSATLFREIAAIAAVYSRRHSAARSREEEGRKEGALTGHRLWEKKGEEN